MPLPKTPAAYPATRSALDKVLQHGSQAEFEFMKPSAAMIWRQKAHKFRKLLRDRDGETPYDGLIFSIPKDRPCVVVVKTEFCPEPKFTGPLAQSSVAQPQMSELAKKIQALYMSGIGQDHIWTVLKTDPDDEIRAAFLEANVPLPDHVEVF